MTHSLQRKLIKKATKWLSTVTTLATAQAIAELLVKTIMAAVQGGHPSYLKYRNEYLIRLSSEYNISFEKLKQVAEKIEDECAPWVKAARATVTGEPDVKPVIVKLGGSVITDKRRPFVVKRAVLRRLARELAAVRGPLVVVHGGGSFGHPVASKYRIAEGYRDKTQLMGMSLTHRAMERLNANVVEALQRAGLPAIAVQPSACVVVSGGEIKSMELAPVKKLLELGIVPVLYGDAVPDLNRGMSILSGDKIVTYLALKMGASRVILGVDVDGVCVEDPKKAKHVEIVRRITPADKELVASLGAAEGKDVTGGMGSKVRELLALAERGVEAEIVNATKPGILKRAVQGERGLGTVVGR